MDLRALRRAASLLEHAKKPTFAVLNGVSPHTGVAEDAAKAIADQFRLEVSTIVWATRWPIIAALFLAGQLTSSSPKGRQPRQLTL
jgi:hypothetical protein